MADYSANDLNQVTSRDIPPYMDVIGESYATNVVTVNGQSPYRNAEYFREELPVDNSSSALWTNVIVSASVGGSVTGSVYVAREPEQFEYDADGNLTNDGRWAYVWDGENRLIQMTVNTNVGPQYKLTFAYDWQGRRIQKTVATNGVPEYTNDFLYDGWNLIATLNSPSSILASYVWGNDLSGRMRGTGGVMCRLCNINQELMDVYITSWKVWKGDFSQLPGALAWANVAYMGWPSTPNPVYNSGNCNPCSITSSLSSFEWYAGYPPYWIHGIHGGTTGTERP